MIPPPPPPPAPGDVPPEKVALKEPPKKTIGEGYEKRELKKLTPEEKAKRRLVWNLTMLAVGLIFVSIVGWLLMSKPKKKDD